MNGIYLLNLFQGHIVGEFTVVLNLVSRVKKLFGKGFIGSRQGSQAENKTEMLLSEPLQYACIASTTSCRVGSQFVSARIPTSVFHAV